MLLDVGYVVDNILPLFQGENRVVFLAILAVAQMAPSMKWRLTIFQCPKTLKTSRTYPRWERDPSLMGQKIQGWSWYGQLKADNMIFIHVNFQDLQQKWAGVRVEVQKIMGMGKILETNN